MLHAAPIQTAYAFNRKNYIIYLENSEHGGGHGPETN
jgi:hypothetical protein